MAGAFRKNDLGFQSRPDAQSARNTLSICMRCRDGREEAESDVRGGARLAEAVMSSAAAAHLAVRGVNCMSQCKRPCVIALSGPDRFTYFFGDLDPTHDADAIAELAALYANSPDGFMARDVRPTSMRAGVLGRLPPLGWDGEAVKTTDLKIATNSEIL